MKLSQSEKDKLSVLLFKGSRCEGIFAECCKLLLGEMEGEPQPAALTAIQTLYAADAANAKGPQK